MSPSVWVLHRIHTIKIPLVMPLYLHICANTYIYVIIYKHCVIYLIIFVHPCMSSVLSLYTSRSTVSLQFSSQITSLFLQRSTCLFSISTLETTKSLFPLWGKWSPQRARRKAKEELPHHLVVGAVTIGAPHLWNLNTCFSIKGLSAAPDMSCMPKDNKL